MATWWSVKERFRRKKKFGDCQLHIEWSAPVPATGNGQGRGNSGIFLMGMYEIQVLDSYENETYFDGQAGAIYKQTPLWRTPCEPLASGMSTIFFGLHLALMSQEP